LEADVDAAELHRAGLPGEVEQEEGQDGEAQEEAEEAAAGGLWWGCWGGGWGRRCRRRRRLRRRRRRWLRLGCVVRAPRRVVRRARTWRGGLEQVREGRRIVIIALGARHADVVVGRARHRFSSRRKVEPLSFSFRLSAQRVEEEGLVLAREKKTKEST
jgi:hypothetical protein